MLSQAPVIRGEMALRASWGWGKEAAFRTGAGPVLRACLVQAPGLQWWKSRP